MYAARIYTGEQCYLPAFHTGLFEKEGKTIWRHATTRIPVLAYNICIASEKEHIMFLFTFFLAMLQLQNKKREFQIPCSLAHNTFTLL